MATDLTIRAISASAEKYSCPVKHVLTQPSPAYRSMAKAGHVLLAVSFVEYDKHNYGYAYHIRLLTEQKFQRLFTHYTVDRTPVV